MPAGAVVRFPKHTSSLTAGLINLVTISLKVPTIQYQVETTYVVHQCAAPGTWYVLMNPLPLATSNCELQFSETLRIATAVQLKKKKPLKCFYITIKTGVLQFKLVNQIKVRRGEVSWAKLFQ